MAVTDLDVSELLQLALLLVAVGALSGFLAGLFGIGGGAILVRVFYECFRLAGVPFEVRMPLCVGTSLAIIIPTSIRSYRGHRARGAVDTEVVRMWWLPILLGVVAGSLIARYAPERLFKIVFVTVAWIAAARLLLARESWKFGDDLPKGPLMRIYGFFVGLLSTLMGHRRRPVRKSLDDLLWPADSSGGRHLVSAGGAGLDPGRAWLCIRRLARGRALSRRAGAAIAICVRLRLPDRRGSGDADQPVDRAARGASGSRDVEEDAGTRLWQLSLHCRGAVRDQSVVSAVA